MCNFPITVKNPRIDFDDIKDRIFLDVPCGKCSACKSSKRMEWYVRAYYEYLDTVNSGGFVYYLTLTYNNKSLPKFKLNDNTFIACFNSLDIRNYIKRVRMTCMRNLDPDFEFKFFLTSEYGGNTHRPHYHVLFFVKNATYKYRFKGIARRQWFQGFTAPGKLNNGEVNSPGALRYVAKYVCKDITTDTYFAGLLKKIPNSSFDDFIRCQPFTRVSQKFGLYALDVADKDNIEQGIIKVPLKGGFGVTRLPRYLDLKAHYEKSLNVNGNVQYVLTKYGEEVMKKRYDRKRTFLLEQITSFLNNNSYDINYFNNLSYVHFDSFAHLKDFFLSKISSVDDFIDYALAFRNYSFRRLSRSSCDGTLYSAREIYNYRYDKLRNQYNCIVDPMIYLMSEESNKAMSEAYSLFTMYNHSIGQINDDYANDCEKTYINLRSLYD